MNSGPRFRAGVRSPRPAGIAHTGADRPVGGRGVLERDTATVPPACPYRSSLPPGESRPYHVEPFNRQVRDGEYDRAMVESAAGFSGKMVRGGRVGDVVGDRRGESWSRSRWRKLGIACQSCWMPSRGGRGRDPGGGRPELPARLEPAPSAGHRRAESRPAEGTARRAR
jgi:hypothetical protein